MQAEDVRLRIIEALTRTDGTLAKQNPDQFLQVVDKIVDYVYKGPREPPKRRGRPPKTDKP